MGNSISTSSSDRLYQILQSPDSEIALELQKKEGVITYQEKGIFSDLGATFKAVFTRQSQRVSNFLKKNAVVSQLKEDFKNLLPENLRNDSAVMTSFDVAFETAFKGEKVTIPMVKSFAEKIDKGFFKDASHDEGGLFSQGVSESEETFRNAELFSEEDIAGLSGNEAQPWQEKFYSMISEGQKNKTERPISTTANVMDPMVVTAIQIDSDSSVKGPLPEAVEVSEVSSKTPSLTSEELTAIARLSGKVESYFKASLFAKPGKIMELKNYYSKELSQDSPEKKVINHLRKWKDEKGERPKSLTQGPQAGESASDWLQRCVLLAKQSQAVA